MNRTLRMLCPREVAIPEVAKRNPEGAKSRLSFAPLSDLLEAQQQQLKA